MDGNITITKKEYLNLKLAEEKLSRLEQGGVDNWEWYGESLNPDGEPDLDKFEEELIKELESK